MALPVAPASLVDRAVCSDILPGLREGKTFMSPSDSASVLREQVTEAAEIIDGMTEWMRCVAPSQVEPGTKAERDSLLRAAIRWEVGRHE